MAAPERDQPVSAGHGKGDFWFWGLLTEEESADLRGRGRVKQWGRGEVIFREHDRSSWVMVLLTGRVKIATGTASGGEVVLAVRAPGALLGEFSAIDGEPRAATVTALEDVSALVVLRPDFEQYLRTHGRVAFLLMRLVVNRLRDADRKRIEFGASDTTGRVSARLVELADRFGEPGPDGVRIAMPLSQDELASWAGSSREAVTRALATLRAKGWIRTSRLRVEVLDLAALRGRATD